MPKFNQMNEGKFLKKEDFPQPALLTITRFNRENVAMANEPEELKWVAYFAEIDRGLVLNSTNLQLIQIATGVDDTDRAVGRKIVVYVDPTVSMAGKIVGGVRIRAPRNVQPTHAPQPQPEPAPAMPSEPEDPTVPF